MISYIDNVLFVTVLILTIFLFSNNFKKILNNIRLGRAENRSDKPILRLKNMFRVAFGQGKMIRRPIAGILHLIVYIGFIIINIELLEIIVDGIFGTHRIFSQLCKMKYSTVCAVIGLSTIPVLG